MRIEAADRAGLERLLRYCARPPFAMNRLKQRGADLVYRCGKGHTEPMQSDKYSGELVLTPLELIDRIAQLVPPPRTHRHRYYGVLAPNSPLRAAVTAMAQVATPEVGSPVTGDAHTDAGTTVAVAGAGVAVQPGPPAKPKPRPPSHYLWAALIARIFEVFPLICPHCGGPMRIITFIADIHKILEHIADGPRCGTTAVRRSRTKVPWASWIGDMAKLINGAKNFGGSACRPRVNTYSENAIR